MKTSDSFLGIVDVYYSVQHAQVWLSELISFT